MNTPFIQLAELVDIKYPKADEEFKAVALLKMVQR